MSEIQKEKVLEFSGIVTGICTDNLLFFSWPKSWFLTAAGIPPVGFSAQAAVPHSLDQEAAVSVAQ